MTPTTLSVFGMGKLGIPMAACFAAKGFRVIGVDVLPATVQAINHGKSPLYEPGLNELIQKTGGRLTAALDAAAAVRDSDATFIITATPSEPDGGFSLRYVLPACEAIGRALRAKSAYHLVVLSSTVMPNSTNGPVKCALEQSSGKQCGVDFGLCYNPELFALGTVIHDFLNPDFLIIGESDPRAGRTLQEIYQSLCENQPPVARMNFVNAELTKLAVNNYMTTKISFANMLARLCERLPEAHVDTVTAALGLDSRIGNKFLKGALGYGGPCFPRDNTALSCLTRRLGVTAPLVAATDLENQEVIARLTSLVKGKLPPSGGVGILGIAFKPDTDVIEQSQGLLLAQSLAEDGVATVVYDPRAMPNARRVLPGAVKCVASATECIRQSDVVVITVPCDEFKNLAPPLFARPGRPRIVVDCWRILNQETIEEVADYVALGVASSKAKGDGNRKANIN